jgi:hypothetical protein
MRRHHCYAAMWIRRPRRSSDLSSITRAAFPVALPGDKKCCVRAGDFRQVHARLRENAEPVAFYGGIDKEGAGIVSGFSALVRHRMRMLRTQLRHSVVQARSPGALCIMLCAGGLCVARAHVPRKPGKGSATAGISIAMPVDGLCCRHVVCCHCQAFP